MARRRKLKLEDIDWLRVERLRRSAFHGQPLGDDDLDYCRQAYACDPHRYGELGERVRHEYRDSLRWGR